MTRLTRLLLAPLAFLFVLAASPEALAQFTADLVVDTAADDQSYSFSASRAACTDGVLDGDCTLREAIRVANASEGDLNGIGFEVTEANGADARGRVTITPTSALPTLFGSGIVIDGSTQPGSSPNTLEDGSNAVIQVQLDGSSTNADADGLQIDGAASVVIRGLAIYSFDGQGIAVRRASSGTVIVGNHIGTDADGAAGLGNGGAGVSVSGGSIGIRVGTDGTGDLAERNVIAFNTGDGVEVSGGAASVLGNAIRANGGLGIDLGGDGVTANDPGDADGGPNDLQNFPVVTSAEAFGGTGEVAFALDAAPGAYRVEVFASGEPDPSGFGEGARFLGATEVVVASGARGQGAASGLGLAIGEVVSATATPVGASGGTSEFSAAVTTVRTNRAPVADAGPDQTVTAGPGGTAEVTLDGSGSSDPDGGDALTYTWTANGETIASGVSPTVALAEGATAITLSVSDGRGGAASDEVVVTVEPASSGEPTLTVTLTPLGSLSCSSYGGLIAFRLSVENETDRPLAQDLWLTLETPSGREYTQLRRRVRLRAGRSASRVFVVLVSGRAADGEYTYTANVGTRPRGRHEGEVTDSDAFSFTKGSAARLASGGTSAKAAEADRMLADALVRTGGPMTDAVEARIDAVDGQVPTEDPASAWGTASDSEWAALTDGVTPEAAASEALALLAPAPNPARGQVAIRYDVPLAGEASVTVYDALGRAVATPADGAHAAGPHTATLDTRTLAPGVYVVRLASGAEAQTRRFTVVR